MLDDKSMELLEEDLKERPFATFQGRCDYMEVMTGFSVGRSTIMCRDIARMVPTRKKGDE